MVYSPSVALHIAHLREVLHRLQAAGFTLNPEKAVLGVSEIKYLGHQISARGVTLLADRVLAINQYPRHKISARCADFSGWSDSTPALYLDLTSSLTSFMLSNGRGVG